jgi:hypothetical protein
MVVLSVNGLVNFVVKVNRAQASALRQRQVTPSSTQSPGFETCCGGDLSARSIEIAISK